VLVQTFADDAQQLVAGLLAESIVDIPEAIEVEPDQGELTFAALG
jgi:hypothetical protein